MNYELEIEQSCSRLQESLKSIRNKTNGGLDDVRELLQKMLERAVAMADTVEGDHELGLNKPETTRDRASSQSHGVTS